MNESPKQRHDDPSLAIVWGAKVIGKNPRETNYLLNTGLLPAEKIGKQWVLTRERLRTRFRGGGEAA
jgi:hypothetical protein